jgi:hypothetical protein
MAPPLQCAPPRGGDAMTLTLQRSAFTVVTIFALAAGCGGPAQPPAPSVTPTPAPGAPPSNPDGPSTMPTPPPAPPPPAPTPTYAGVFALVAPIDLTQNGVLPGVLGPSLDALTKLHDHPGQAILEIVESANIPSVSGAINGLPGFVKSLLSTLLDKLITDELYQNVPVADQIAGIISGITDVSKTMELHDRMTLHTPAASGKASVEQQLTDVGFTLLGSNELVTLDPSEQTAAHTLMGGAIAPHANKPVADADLVFDGGQVSLPFGDLVLRAAGPLVFAQFGATDLKGALTAVVPCSAAAQSISDGLGDWLPASTIETICTTALGLIADEVTGQIKNVTLQGQISKATAQLHDASPAKYLASHISDGQWVWGFSLAGAQIQVPSTFAGDRVGDAQ